MASSVAFSTVSVAARRNARVSSRKTAPVAALRSIGARTPSTPGHTFCRETRVTLARLRPNRGEYAGAEGQGGHPSVQDDGDADAKAFVAS